MGVSEHSSIRYESHMRHTRPYCELSESGNIPGYIDVVALSSQSSLVSFLGIGVRKQASMYGLGQFIELCI